MTDHKPPTLEFHGSRLFTAWLKNAGVSLAFTTYQAGKVFFIGTQPDGRLSVFERTFERPMGLGTAGRVVAVSCAEGSSGSMPRHRVCLTTSRDRGGQSA